MLAKAIPSPQHSLSSDSCGLSAQQDDSLGITSQKAQSSVLHCNIYLYQTQDSGRHFKDEVPKEFWPKATHLNYKFSFSKPYLNHILVGRADFSQK